MRMHNADENCGIAQAATVLGDWWNVLVLREVARGHVRFDALAAELGLSRKVLTERLGRLVAQGVLQRSLYQRRPVRYEYLLTDAGAALLPLLVAMQDWGDRWLLGDGSLTGTNAADEPPAQRLHELVGQRIPYVALPSTRSTTADAPSAHGTTADDPSTRGAEADARSTRGTAVDSGGLSARGATVDVVDVGARATVIFGYPATGRPTPLPDGWGEIPGAAGCTLENRLFAARYDEFAAKGIAVRGVSTQRTDEQQAFATAEEIPHLLLSDLDLELTAALRLPTFRAGGYERLKRFVLIVGADRVVRSVRYPVTDIADAVDWALTTG